MSSYRTHGVEGEHFNSYGAPSPYTPGSDHFFFSPTSPNPQQQPLRPYDDTEYSALPAPGDDHRASVGTQSTTPFISDPPGRFRSRYNRTFSNLSKTEEMLRKWSTGVHWYVPTSMVVIFLVGCMGALGHHLFNTSLDGEPAVNQLFMTRTGVFLAFCTKAALVGAVVLSYRQRLWQTLREKPISVRGLDALFSVVEDPTWFILAPEIFVKAKVASVMALATWLIPIASVMSPGSLTAQLREVTYDERCNVKSVNFTLEAVSDWRSPRHGQMGFNIAFFNTTPPPPAQSVADWYDQPSQNTNRITQLSIYTDRLVPERDSPCAGFNCTYDLQFVGPWYNCSRQNWDASPFNRSDFAPQSAPLAQQGRNYIFQAITQDPDESLRYKLPQDGYNDTNYSNQGIFRIDPDIWIAQVTNTTRINEDASTRARWPHVMEPIALKCVHEKANYRVTSKWTNDRLAHRKATITESRTLFSRWGVSEIGPRPDMERYKEFVAYYTIGTQMRNILEGTLILDNSTSNVVTHTKMSPTRLANRKTAWAAADLVTTLHDFYEDLVMSFISEPFMEVSIDQEVDCQKKRYENRFRYVPSSLWIGYSIAIFLSFCAIIIGSMSIRHNGMCSDTTFSKILVTTRNTTLDKLVMMYPGVALGGDPMPKELERTELRFGVIDPDRTGHESDPLLSKHTAFGLAKETTPIHRSDVQRTLQAQDDSNMELGSRGMPFSGAGMGALPG